MKCRCRVSTRECVFLVIFLASLASAKMLFADERKINDDTGTAQQKNPAMAASYSGCGIVCWEDYRNGDPDIYGQVFNQKGQWVGANFILNDAPTTGKQVRPAVAMNSRGQFIVVWEDSSTAGVVIYARWFAANLKPLTDRIKVSSISAVGGRLYPAVAMDYTGNAIVCWPDGRDRETLEIYMQRYDNLGHPIGVNRRVNDVIVGIQQHPAVSMNSSGEFVIVWQDTRDANGITVWGQRYSVFGTPLGNNRLLSHHTDRNDIPMFPSVALQRNGDYMACWHFSSPPQLYGCFIANADSSLNKEFSMSDAGGGVTFIASQDACVYPRMENGFVVSFVASSPTSGNHVYTRSFDVHGNVEAPPMRRSEAPGFKGENSLVIGWQGIHTVIWEGRQTTDQDIYGQCWGPQIPLNVTAGSGFNGRVPISWDPPYGMDTITHYTIRRSTNYTGPFSLLATVDLSARGAAGALMRDWIDGTVVNGATYYYFVSSDEAGTDGASMVVKATPSAPGHVLNSPWSTSTPNIDGVINEAEWSEARKMNIAAPCSDHEVMFYVKNDGSHLYLAADDPLDKVIDALNQLCILYDLDNNDIWPTGPASNEGVLSINSSGAWIVAYYGTYPNHLAANGAVKATNVVSRISTGSGHVQYEAAITIAHTAGQTMGFAAWVQDPGSVYAMHYGWAGEWPFGHLWETASTLGQLTFNGPPPAPAVYAVTNTNDSGPGSLRQAVLDAETHSGQDSVLFRIPTTDPGYDAATGVWTIQLSSSLALIKRGTIVDGSSQARYLGHDPNPLGPEIVLDGTPSTETVGIIINSNANHVKGFCIQNFKHQFIMIYGDSNRVANCYLGTDATGMHRIVNDSYGIVIYGGSYNIIGGGSQERNVIAGLAEDGIQLKTASRYNRIAGNYIGINAAGTDTLANFRGVAVGTECKKNIVGPANVISGNKQRGVTLSGSHCDSNKVVGNFIGTDPSGRAALGNRYYGIYIEACACNAIGGAAVSDRNVISGNGYVGIRIAGEAAVANILQGNYIGVDVTGSMGLPNHSDGVHIFLDANHNLIGGENPGEGNVISYNNGHGIRLDNCRENQIAGNFIGTDSTGLPDLRNSAAGILLLSSSWRNLIGPKNVIAYNQEPGIYLNSADADYNQITQNAIYKNKYHGAIFLEPGANQDIAAPIITELHPISGQSFPYATIELFSTATNQADIYETTIVAGSDGHFSWNGAAAGPFVTATATDSRCNTSALSTPLATGAALQTITQPLEFKLEQNYPNPFNPTTTIRFCVKERCRVHLTVFDLLGRQTALLVDEFYTPGWHEKSVQLPAHASGVYFYRIKMKDYCECKKMILLQ